jgi:predicted secreted Zn-dependent protease
MILQLLQSISKTLWYSSKLHQLLVCGACLFIPANAFGLENCSSAPPELKEIEKHGVSLDFFSVSGTSAQEIIESLRLSGPREENGTPRTAQFSWYIEWNWPEKIYQGLLVPDYSNLSVSSELSLVFPCWVEYEQSPSDIQKRWAVLASAIAVHEQGHLERFLKGQEQLREGLLEYAKEVPLPSPAQMNERGHTYLQSIRKEDIEYDKKTKNGKTQGVRYVFLHSSSNSLFSNKQK